MASSWADGDWSGQVGFLDSCGADARPFRLPQDVSKMEGADVARRLVSTIEGEIIPRLMLVRTPPMATSTAAMPVSTGAPAKRPDDADVEGLTRLLLSHDVDVAVAFVESLRQAGVPVENLLLNLMAPAARRLGTLWEDDLVDFTQVTVGLFRLHQLLRRNTPDLPAEAESREFGRRALLLPLPGEQHTFGLWVVADFMRRSGWHVQNDFATDAESIVDTVRQEWFAVIGLTIACDSRIDALAALIQSVRRASRNRAIGVMVGGPLLLQRPELAALVGADATATDARQAVAQAEAVCKLLETTPVSINAS